MGLLTRLLGAGKAGPRDDEVFISALRLGRNKRARKEAGEAGLEIYNVARRQSEAFDDDRYDVDIAEVGIEVYRHPHGICLPVLREPFYHARAEQLSPGHIRMRVGNDASREPRWSTLGEVLTDVPAHLQRPDEYRSPYSSLWIDPDERVMVRRQATFVPVPSEGRVRFCPVYLDPSAYEGRATTLTLLATMEETSVTVIDNAHDEFHVGSISAQRLFRNIQGERAVFEAFASEGVRRPTSFLVVQVPLRSRGRRSGPLEKVRWGIANASACQAGENDPPPDFAAAQDIGVTSMRPTELQGPFLETKGIEVVRDPERPVCVTMQFCYPTLTGVPSRAELSKARTELDLAIHSAPWIAEGARW